MTATVESTTVRVGDIVGFKSDIEQAGKIFNISTNSFGKKVLFLEPTGDHFYGEYLRDAETTKVFPEDCWI